MIGIDVGDRFIKLVALRRRRSRWFMQACLAQETSGDSAAALRSILQLLPSFLQSHLPRIAIAVPASELVVRTMQLPAGFSDQQCELALGLEFEQLLGVAPDNICFDYRRAPGLKQSVHTQQPVLAVACRTSLMTAALAPLAAAGLTPAMVSPDAMLLADKLSETEPDSSSGSDCDVFVDMGAAGVRLHALRAGVLLYSRNHVLNTDSRSDADSTACLLVLRRAIQQYLMADMLSRPAMVFLYGGGAMLTGVVGLLQQSFGVPVKQIDPFMEWQIEKNCAATQTRNLHAGAFTLACLLASQDASCV